MEEVKHICEFEKKKQFFLVF